MIKFSYIDDDELPYKVEIDEQYLGAGISEKKAIMAALRVGKFIPEGCINSKRAASHIFWNYEVSEGWNILIQKLEA